MCRYAACSGSAEVIAVQQEIMESLDQVRGVQSVERALNPWPYLCPCSGQRRWRILRSHGQCRHAPWSAGAGGVASSEGRA
jgi:hypothetical protein